SLPRRDYDACGELWKIMGGRQTTCLDTGVDPASRTLCGPCDLVVVGHDVTDKQDHCDGPSCTLRQTGSSGDAEGVLQNARKHAGKYQHHTCERRTM
ncbi:hypothetical protein BaRGS_00010771, partial [Batillaria attramentaria]